MNQMMMMMTSYSSSLVRIFEFGERLKISCGGGGGSGRSSSCSPYCLSFSLSSSTATTYYNNVHGGRPFSVLSIRSRSRSTKVVVNHHPQIADHDHERSSFTAAEEKVHQVILKQAASLAGVGVNNNTTTNLQFTTTIDQSHFLTDLNLLNEAYDRCRRLCAEHAKSYYLGTLLMTPERQRAIWALYVWGQRTDQIVDGCNKDASAVLDIWEQRLIDLFEGHPSDLYDAAVSHTVSKYPIDIQLFKDMIVGMRQDLIKSRYKNFDELYLYCYHVAGTAALMSVPIMGISPDSNVPTESVYKSALALGIANQLTNILRDVGEDATMLGRIYLPQDELASAGLSEDDIFRGQVTNKWRNFMKGQIKRARMYYDEAEKGVNELNSASRWPVWTTLMQYRHILDAIEANDYNNFTKRAYVGKAKKLLFLPVAYARAVMNPSSQDKR